jgi:hypothetical protein
MKKSVLFSLMFVLISLLINDIVSAQKNEWVKQVIVVNGGKFESIPTPADYVTIQSYNPVTKQTNVFGTIYTQSTQDVVIKGNFAYVAAKDSIVKYNIDTYQRVAAVADSGLSKLYILDNRLVVTKQYPVKRFFVEILNADDLSLLSRVQNISGACGDAIAANDSLYVAVNGGSNGTEGKLAVITTDSWTLKREINFGTAAKGIMNLFANIVYIYAVCISSEGSLNVGNITRYAHNSPAFTNYTLDVKLGEGYGVLDSLLYAKMNYGIGTFNLNSTQIQDPELIPDPGYVNRIIFSSAATDYVNKLLYLNLGNLITFGRGVIATKAGDSIGSYPTGLNADAIAIDYRTPVGIDARPDSPQFSIFPNPVRNELIVNLLNQSIIQNIRVSDLTGKSHSISFSGKDRSITVNCSNLSRGMYFLTVKTNQGISTQKFIKE